MTLDEIQALNKNGCPKFSAFAKEQLPMPGDKKFLNEVLNREILVTDFRIKESKRRQGTKCLQLQFLLDDKVCVAFTGSSVLIDQVNTAYEKGVIPFQTTIVKVDKYFSFS